MELKVDIYIKNKNRKEELFDCSILHLLYNSYSFTMFHVIFLNLM